MPTFTPRLFTICIMLAIGPPAAMLALHYDDWKPKPIDPRFAVGELLFFESDGCGACRAMKPVVAELKDQGFIIRTIDVGNQTAKAMEYGIHSIPAFVL